MFDHYANFQMQHNEMSWYCYRIFSILSNVRPFNISFLRIRPFIIYVKLTCFPFFDTFLFDIIMF